MRKVDDISQVLPALRTKFYEWDNILNMARDAKMVTSSQLLLDLTNKVFKLSYREHVVDTFLGVRTELPTGYTPKITIMISKLSKK